MVTLLYILSALSITGTLLPIWRNPHWVIRGQMNLRALYFGLNTLCLVGLALYSNYTIGYTFTSVGLSISIWICLQSIWPYTILAKTEINDVEVEILHRQIKIFAFNVYQANNNIDLLLASIKIKDPDIILLLETDEKWYKGIGRTKSKYPYIVKEIKSDTYGLMLLSKLPLNQAKIHHLISNKIPSVEVELKIDNHHVRILGLHPEPPIFGERTTSINKDEEIIAAASYLNTIPKEEALILIGDLNDVAWSNTSNQFRKITNMKDPRIGRGMFATFPAYSPIKFPLDHIYCTPHFDLVDYAILGSMGSDHHAIFIIFQLNLRTVIN